MELAAGLCVGNVRHFVGDAIEVVEVDINTGFIGDCKNVQHGIGAATKGICYRNYYGDLYYRSEGEFPDAYLQRLPKLPAEKEVFSEEGIKNGVLCEAKRRDYETQV